MAFCPEGPQAACILCAGVIIIVKLLQLLEYIIMYSIYNSSGQLLGGCHCGIPLPAPNPDCIGEPTHSGHKRLTIFKNP
ncbi:hypothetical protein BDL97_01G156800 [Sphagnum fallax]|nr:hypothetical protein BDL97_01G156800 [Sphagnum fallax]